MFKSNVTQTYNFQDASQEIIIMLLGAFLLGCLLMWLLNKLFNRDYSVENTAYRYDTTENDEINTLNQTATLQAQTTSDVRIVDTPSNSRLKVTKREDDLTKIGGIDKPMLEKLNRHGITSFTDLRDIRNKDLKALQQGQLQNKRQIETWPHQASLAAKEDWQKLEEYQAFIKRAQLASSSTQTHKPANTDDLSVVEGINPEMERILYNKGIYTFKQLSETDSTLLKKHFESESTSYNKIETESWPHQAAMAEKGQWDELKIYQEFMHSDSDETAASSSRSNKKSSPSVVKLKQGSNQNLSDSDNLKKIEGIGPKIEEVLNNGGIYTYSQLQNSDTTRLRDLLDDAGSQFKMHDPESWPQQAEMANEGDWDTLKDYHQSLTDKQNTSKSKQNSKQTKRKTRTKDKSNLVNSSDDLKKIEGIGPKIQELLNNADIYSFEQLSVTSRDYLKNLLDQAGPQFRMHEPESWSHQAKLAAKDEWEELKKYQDFLIAGRE